MRRWVDPETGDELVGELPPLEFVDACDALRHEIETAFPASRERALRLTKLDEVELWATRAAQTFEDMTKET